MRRITLRTVFVLLAWALASACDPGSDQADGGAANTGNGAAGDDGDSSVEERDAEATAGTGGGATGGAGGSSGTGADAGDADAAGGTGGGASDGGASDASTQLPDEPTVLVPFGHIRGLSSPQHIEVDDEYVYFTSSWVGADPPTPLPEPSRQYVVRVPKDGGEVEALYESPNHMSSDFAMDDTSLYVYRALDVLTGVIVKVAKDGSGGEELTPIGASGGGVKGHITIDDQNVYFEGPVSGEIQAQPLDGGPIATIVDDPNTPLPDGFSYYPMILGLTTDGTNLYYSGNTDGMFQVPVGGGTPLLLHTRNTDAMRISSSGTYPAVADGIVYWTYYGYIYSVPVGGGEPTVVEPADANRGESSHYAVIDGEYLYYLNGGLRKAALDGSSVVTLLVDNGTYNLGAGIAIDETSVYMHAANGQSLVKVPK